MAIYTEEGGRGDTTGIYIFQIYLRGGRVCEGDIFFTTPLGHKKWKKHGGFWGKVKIRPKYRGKRAKNVPLKCLKIAIFKGIRFWPLYPRNPPEMPVR